MSKIPGKDNFHAVDRRHSDMKSIFRIFRGHCTAKNNLLGQRPSLVVDVEYGESLQGRESLPDLVGIAFSSLEIMAELVWVIPRLIVRQTTVSTIILFQGIFILL